MKVRRGPDRIRDVIDHGPGAANVAGIYAINVIAYVPASPEAEIIRRWVDPVLAEPDPPKPVPDYTIRPKVVAPPKVVTVKVRKPRVLKDDTALWAAIRETRGNVTSAAEILGRPRSSVRGNIRYRIARGVVPDDIVAMLAAPARRPSGWKKGTRHHTPESRALISLRLREYNAARRAA